MHQDCLENSKKLLQQSSKTTILFEIDIGGFNSSGITKTWVRRPFILQLHHTVCDKLICRSTSVRSTNLFQSALYFTSTQGTKVKSIKSKRILGINSTIIWQFLWKFKIIFKIEQKSIHKNFKQNSYFF